jgi:hypothetical protein
MRETLQTLLREALAIADEPVGETIRERESRIIAWKRATRAALSSPVPDASKAQTDETKAGDDSGKA